MTEKFETSASCSGSSWRKNIVAIFVGLSFCLILVTNTAADDAIRMGSGDRIAVKVYGEADLSLETQLGESGVINYPFLGEIKASGLTPQELEELITESLKGDYLVEPVVHVSIEEYRPLFVDGEVATPGAYGFQPGLTVGKAIALAKGLTERASKRKITVERRISGEKYLIDATLSTELHPGDVINVGQRFF